MALSKPAGLILRGAVWHIDKDLFGTTRICESTRTGALKEAVLILARRIEEARASHFFGVRTPRTFREAATRFLQENEHKRSRDRDARATAMLGGEGDASRSEYSISTYKIMTYDIP